MSEGTIYCLGEERLIKLHFENGLGKKLKRRSVGSQASSLEREQVKLLKELVHLEVVIVFRTALGGGVDDLVRRTLLRGAREREIIVKGVCIIHVSK